MLSARAMKLAPIRPGCTISQAMVGTLRATAAFPGSAAYLAFYPALARKVTVVGLMRAGRVEELLPGKVRKLAGQEARWVVCKVDQEPMVNLAFPCPMIFPAAAMMT